MIYHYLLLQFGFTDRWYPWYDLNHVEPVKDNERCTIYWDFAMQTNTPVKYNKPDIAVFYKTEDEILLIEGSVPWDENLGDKIMEKRNKYIPLGMEMKILHGKSKCII